MGLASKMNELYDFLSFDIENPNKVKEIQKYRPFREDISRSCFGDDFWIILDQNRNKKIGFYFNKIEGLNPRGSYVLYFKMIFLTIIYYERFALNTSKILFMQLKTIIEYIVKQDEYNEKFLSPINCLDFARYIESCGGGRDNKNRKWRIIPLIKNNQGYISSDFKVNFENFSKSYCFSDQPTKKASENFDGHEPLSFTNSSFLIVKSYEFLFHFGEKILEINKTNSVENAQRLIRSNEALSEYFEYQKIDQVKHLLTLLQGACYFLVTILCPMRMKEFQGLKLKDFKQGESFSYLIPIVEKTHKGRYPMPITNQALIAVQILQKLLPIQDQESYLICNPANPSSPYSSYTINKKISFFCNFSNAKDAPTTHRLRTTCARYFLAYYGEEGLEFFKTFVGHNSIEMTKHYAKLSKEEVSMMQVRNYNILKTLFELVKQKNEFERTTPLPCGENKKKVDLPFCSIYLDQNDALAKDDDFISFVKSLSNDENKDFDVALHLQKKIQKPRVRREK